MGIEISTIFADTKDFSGLIRVGGVFLVACCKKAYMALVTKGHNMTCGEPYAETLPLMGLASA